MSSKFIFLESVDLLGFGILPQYHLLLGAFVVLWIVWSITKRRYNNERPPEISNNEMEQKIANWHPEPLIKNPAPKDHRALKPRLVTSKVGKRITVNGEDCLNLGTHNYLGFVESVEIIEDASSTIGKYGVGSCGPRGFYGTVDVHLQLEEQLAKFMETEDAIVYSYGFSTIASAIPAYCKGRDLVFVDERVNFAVQKGLQAARSNVKYFQHNDWQDLEKLLKAQDQLDKRNPAKAAKIKRFLIVEGIYMNTGKICPLPELVKLCRKYKLRFFIDESISFGVLGKHGRGVTEHFGVPRHEIDMIIGSLDWAVGSIGGFCVGSSFIIEHQRLAGIGYCFSASLPPYLTTAAITAVKTMEKKPEIIETLKQNCIRFDSDLKKLKHYVLSGFAESPVKHLYLKDIENNSQALDLLYTISNHCIENGVAIIPAAYLEVEQEQLKPSLRICVSALLQEQDIKYALDTLVMCTEVALSSLNQLN